MSPALAVEPFAEQAHLRRGSGTVQAFQDHEPLEYT